MRSIVGERDVLGLWSVCLFVAVRVCNSTSHNSKLTYLAVDEGQNFKRTFSVIVRLQWVVLRGRRACVWNCLTSTSLGRFAVTVHRRSQAQKSSRESKAAYEYSYPVGGWGRNDELWARGCGLYVCVYIPVACVYNLHTRGTFALMAIIGDFLYDMREETENLIFQGLVRTTSVTRPIHDVYIYEDNGMQFWGGKTLSYTYLTYYFIIVDLFSWCWCGCLHSWYVSRLFSDYFSY